MDTVFVKKGSSKSYTNLITSSAPVPLKKKEKKLSEEPIGQQQKRQPPLGINNVETETTHRSTEPQLERAVASFTKSIWSKTHRKKTKA